MSPGAKRDAAAVVGASRSVLVENVRVPTVSHASNEPIAVWLANGRVRELAPKIEADAGAERVDGSGRWLLPGWIDLQLNDIGWLSQGLKEPAEHARRVRQVLAYQAARGVTGLALATLAAPVDEISAYLRGIAEVLQAQDEETDGVLVGGLVEGSFMNPEFHGAHNPRWVLPPTTEVFHQFLGTGGLKLVNVAPEMGSEALEVIRQATANGVIVGIGHAKPHAERLREAVDAGARYVIHLGNGPTGSNLKRFHDGGMLEEALRNDRLVVTVIVDEYHVHPQLVRDWIRRKELSRFVAVSDAGFSMGAPAGEFEVFGVRGRTAVGAGYLEVVTADGPEGGNPLSSDRANLFGAAADMPSIFRSLLNLLTQQMEGVYYRSHPAHPLAEAVDMAVAACSRNPAQLVGSDDRGHLQVNARADAVLVKIDGEPGAYDVSVERVWLGESK